MWACGPAANTLIPPSGNPEFLNMDWNSDDAIGSINMICLPNK